MIKYDKLVRDLIPEIIQDSGKQAEIEIVDNEIAFEYLVKKLDEEVSEFKQDKNLEELADVMEVLFGLAHKMGYTEEDLLMKRQEKKSARGGFKRNIVLKSTR
ncbi:phosphoribosyl-ATP pyrophosphohydrolase [Turicibacter sanguinis]|uniref:phosphoribosyl-ATP pyrophosphohydrolase n=1 Tax=Turicibacter sanguinis TaxID=154288 RepID=UPI0039964857